MRFLVSAVKFGCVLALCSPAVESQVPRPFDAPVLWVKDATFDPPFRRLLDYDGDGDVDVVGQIADDLGDTARTSVWLNDGAGNLTLLWEDYGGADPQAPASWGHRVETGHLDGDGLEDFVVTGGRRMTMFLSQGDVEPDDSWKIELTAPATFQGLAVVDIDGDGLAERISAIRTSTTEPSQLMIYRPDGSESSHELAFDVWKLQLHTLEANGDGMLDVIISGVTTSNVPVLRMYYSTPTGFVDGPVFDGLGLEGGATAPGDVDGDGDDDVVLWGGSSGEYRILRRTGSEAWSAESIAVGGPGEFLFDIDGDGDLDGVCCGGGGTYGDYQPQDHASPFEISINVDGAGTFAPAFQVPGLGSNQLAGVADLDGNGHVDLVAGRVAYYALRPLSEPPFGAETSLPDLKDAFVTDFDRDGDPDVGFSLAGVHTNQGDGSFVLTPVVQDAAPASGSFVGPGFPGDFNGDGVTDLIVEHRASDTSLVGMRLLSNNGGGGLVDSGPASDPLFTFVFDHRGADGAISVDFDRDGDVDLLTRTAHSLGGWASWTNDGSGYFTYNQFFPNERAEKVVDLDLDGFLDVIVSGSPGFGLYQHLWVRLGTAPGVFGEAQSISTWSINVFDGFFDIADLHIDGYPDIILTDWLGRVLILRNDLGINGTFGFSAWGGLSNLSLDCCGDLPDSYYSFVSDVDGDGLLDITAGPLQHGANAARVWLRNPGPTGVGFGTFAGPIDQLVDRGPRMDANGDGDMDIVGTFCFPNNAVQPPLSGERLQYGTPTTGTGGMPLTFGVSDFQSAKSAKFRVTGALGDAPGLVAFSLLPAELADVPVPGATVYLEPSAAAIFGVQFGGDPGVAGTGMFTLDIPVSPAMAGLAVYHQAFALDPGAAFGWVASNALKVVYGGSQ